MGKKPRPVNIDGVWHIENKRNTVLSWLWMKIKKTEPPYYCYYSIWTIIFKPIRKWFSAVLIPTIPFTNLRVSCYKWCGYKIGKNVFIGMHCYLDDVCYDLMEIGNNVTISYGVYFAGHGRNQGHNSRDDGSGNGELQGGRQQRRGGRNGFTSSLYDAAGADVKD